MKLAARISSIRRSAWKQCRSCSADSDSMCRDSLARWALAGWIVSPSRSSTLVTGSCASQSICRSGCRALSSRAIARSRWAWPSPIGDEMKSARGPPVRPKHGRVPRGALASESVLREISQHQVDLDGLAPVGEMAGAPRRARATPRSAARARGRPVGGVVTSRSPWITSTGQPRPRASARSAPAIADVAAEDRGDQRVRIRFQSPADAVLDALRRMGLREGSAR